MANLQNATLSTNFRLFYSKPAFSTKGGVIGELIPTIEATLKFTNGIEFIKEFDVKSGKFKAVSKNELLHSLSDMDRPDLYRQLQSII